MKRLSTALLTLAFCWIAAKPASAIVIIDKGTIAVSPTLGPSIELNNTSTFFKIGADVDYMFGKSFGFIGGMYFGFKGNLFNLELAPGVKYRFLSLYKHNVDLGIRGQLYFDFYRAGGSSLVGIGVKFGPSFRYFVKPKIGIGADLLFKMGGLDLPGSGLFQQSGGFAFAASLDLMFGATFLF